MDTIIARQDVARRRRPYTPIVSSGAKSPSFLEIPTGSGKIPRNLPGFGGIQAAASHSSLYEKQVVNRHKPREKRASAGPSPLLKGMAALPSLIGSSVIGLGKGLSRIITTAPARIGGMFFRPAGAEGFAHGHNPSFDGGFVGGADYAPAFDAVAGFRTVHDETGSRQTGSRAAKRRLPRWVWLASSVILVLGLALGLFLALGKATLRVPAEGLLPSASTADDSTADLLLAYLSPELDDAPDEDSIKAVPLPKALEFSSYTVKPGDSLGSIAKRFGRTADSILSVNGIKSVKAMKTGTVLKVPNMDGVLHVVARGESLGKIARDSKTEMTAIVDANDLGTSTLQVGQSIFIPGARLQASELQRIYGTTIIWPVRGPLSSYFGIRSDPFTGVRRFHAGIDIAVDLGTPVKAAMDGRIADMGYNANYGNYIIMNNGDGLQTLYGHLSAFCVTAGQSIAVGTVIAKSGNTGYSTGPHLHFGIYKQGTATNPLKMLK